MVYQYLPLGGKNCISLAQSPVYLFWLLIWRRSFLPKAIGKKALIKSIFAKATPMFKTQVFVLPVNGTWCRSVRGGVKVFDLRRQSVFKVYAPGTDKELIKKEIASFKEIGSREFAPSLKDWSLDEGWYEEEFFSGLSGYDLVPHASIEKVMEPYFSFIEPNLEEIILAGSPAPLPVLRYIEGIEQSLAAGQCRTSDAVAAQACSFIHETSNRLRALPGQNGLKIQLTFCHGDYHQFNMFLAGGVLRLIDWEAAQRLSLLFDFYNFFFSQIYLGNRSFDWPKAVDRGLETIRRRLSAKLPHMSGTLFEWADLYRLVYYIERLQTFLGSFGLDGWRISRWIEAFEQFEENLGGPRFQSYRRENSF